MGKPQSIATLLLHHCVSVNKIPCFMCPRGSMDECLLLRTLRDSAVTLKKQKGKAEMAKEMDDVLLTMFRDS